MSDLELKAGIAVPRHLQRRDPFKTSLLLRTSTKNTTSCDAAV
jgi:hypothetical protein